MGLAWNILIHIQLYGLMVLKYKIPILKRERERERVPEPANLGLMGLPWLTWSFLLSRQIWCITKFYNQIGKTKSNPFEPYLL